MQILGQIWMQFNNLRRSGDYCWDVFHLLFWCALSLWPFGTDLWMTLYMVNSAFQLFLLRGQPFLQFNFPRGKSVPTISLICALGGRHPNLRAAPPDVPILPLWFAVATSLVMVWLTFLVIVGVHSFSVQ